MNQKNQAIKSFVIRQGHMSQGQKEAFSKLWPVYGLEKSDDLLNFKEIFKNHAPVSLEIGFGNGDTLIYLAQKYPQKNFIGIEVHKPGIGALFLKLEKHQIKNVRAFCGNALEVIPQQIPDECLENVYLLFPDPWPKRKHHKRRIIQSHFITLIWEKLIWGGKFYLATDWEAYAKQIQNLFSQNLNFEKIQSDPERPMTKFESRGKALGYPIWDFIFEKKSSSYHP